MHRSSAFFTTLLLGLLVLVQAVLAKLPPPGNYRIVSAVGNRNVRAKTPGSPLQVTSATTSTGHIWQLKHLSNGKSTLKVKGTPNFARAGPGMVISHAKATDIRLRPVGTNLYEFAMNTGSYNHGIWTVYEDKVALRPRDNSVKQKFRFVRV
ncbi:hypothetical protein BGZ73_000466 [Actinomortierella ambigua]|nr:hypothetical protein BGZ73_000466 [Actinomortierella ambigua]